MWKVFFNHSHKQPKKQICSGSCITSYLLRFGKQIIFSGFLWTHFFCVRTLFILLCRSGHTSIWRHSIKSFAKHYYKRWNHMSFIWSDTVYYFVNKPLLYQPSLKIMNVKLTGTKSPAMHENVCHGHRSALLIAICHFECLPVQYIRHIWSF